MEMSKSFNLNSPWLKVLGVVLFILIIRFGLSAYASNQAEETIKAKLDEAGVLEHTSWDDISSSPLGGEIILHNFSINFPMPNYFGRQQNYEFAAKKIILKGFNSEENIITDAGVEIIDASLPEAETDADYVNALNSVYNDSFIMKMAYASGLKTLPPLSFNMNWQIKDDDAFLKIAFQQPELLQADGKLKLEGDFSSLIKQIQNEPENYVASYTALMQLQQKASLESISIDIEDNGLLGRMNKLTSRYQNASYNSKKVDIYDDVLRDCESNIDFLENSDGCKRLAKFLSADKSSLSIEAEIKSPIRLYQINGHDLERFEDKISLKIK